MFPRPPRAIAEEAARLELGRSERTYRAWRIDPVRAAWLGVAAGIVLALPLFALGAPVGGALLVPLAALGATAAAMLLRPAGGHRWLATYEHGFVDAREAGTPLALRWEWFRGGPEFPPDGGAFVTVARPPAGGGGSSAAGDPAGWIRVPLGGLEPADDLLLAVRQHAPAGGAGAVDAGPDPARSRAEDAEVRRRRLLVSAVGVVIVALLPAVAYAAIGPTDGEPAAAPSPTRRPAFLPTLGLKPPTGPPPTLAPPPAPAPPALPENIYGYSSVCEGTGFAGAARYGGRAPHPIYVVENFVQGPARWYSENPAKIQIVACVQTRKGRVVDRCEYFGDGKKTVQNMVLGRYTLTFREARTARVIGRARIDGADADCLYLLYGRREANEQQVTVPTKSQLTKALRRYVE